ncbi:TPA: hypothetical protein PEO98_002168 [Enterobacter hormaechei subsp. hoffmannii]|nr:hypothetical protein [Enterobacter hormaechei subsp. hoffmannii]
MTKVTTRCGASSKPEISAGHPITKAFLPHQRVTTEGKGMDEKVEFPSGFSNLMYALTKEAARNSFLDFLEEWGIEDYDEIKAFLAKNGVKTYC